jgi:4-methyl-5(b-hydroxyethyl)-thiazole monophosphate biosynthesis
LRIFFILTQFVMTKIAVQLAEGFEEIEAISIIDVLRRANIEVITTSISDNIEVNGAHNIKVIADQVFTNVDFSEIDMIVLPGGIPGAINLKEHKGLQKQILDFHNNGKPLGAICAAPLVFGNLGILKNKTATCYPGFEDQLKGAKTTGKAVEVDGNIITGKGAGVAIEFAIKIVEFWKGKELADELAKKMILQKDAKN